MDPHHVTSSLCRFLELPLTSSLSVPNTSLTSLLSNHTQPRSFFNLSKPSRNFTYHQVRHSIILHSAQIALMCFVRISEQTATCTVNISNSPVFYNRGWKCSLRCTHRVLIQSRLCFVLKGLMWDIKFHNHTKQQVMLNKLTRDYKSLMQGRKYFFTQAWRIIWKISTEVYTAIARQWNWPNYTQIKIIQNYFTHVHHIKFNKNSLQVVLSATQRHTAPRKLSCTVSKGIYDVRTPVGPREQHTGPAGQHILSKG
jgi:hypothetical protein